MINKIKIFILFIINNKYIKKKKKSLHFIV